MNSCDLSFKRIIFVIVLIVDYGGKGGRLLYWCRERRWWFGVGW